jgi:DNA mismatch repair protein MutS
LNTIKGIYYPSLVGKTGIVKNDVEFDKHTVLTGPNASGKTTFLKAIAINTLLSQQVGLGFYEEYRLSEPYKNIHSYLNIPDTSERDSLFEAESRRCKIILEKIANSSTTDKHLCIFDELFSGTNPVDASHSAYSFLKHLCIHYPYVDFVLTTHYTDICRKIEEKNGNKDGDEKDTGRQMVNRQMNVLQNENHSLTMTYKIIPGISDIKGASNILENMGFPDEIVQEVRQGH